MKMLKDSTLKFSHSSKLNDPFDCHPGLIDHNYIQQGYIMEMVRGDDGKLVSKSPYIHSKYQKRTRVCSLSKIYNSLLMWAYYAKSHTGVCIGLDTDKVFNLIGSNNKTDYPIIGRWEEVKYHKIIEKCRMDSNDPNPFFYQLLTKAIDWEHKEEMRILIYGTASNDEDVFHKISGECFAKMYLGARISSWHEKRIINLARKLNPEIRICQMQPNSDEFKLDAFPI